MWFLEGTGEAGMAWGLHTRSSRHGRAGSIHGCLKAEDPVPDAGRTLGLVHFSCPRLCDLCRMQGCLSPGAPQIYRGKSLRGTCLRPTETSL